MVALGIYRGLWSIDVLCPFFRVKRSAAECYDPSPDIQDREDESMAEHIERWFAVAAHCQPSPHHFGCLDTLRLERSKQVSPAWTCISKPKAFHSLPADTD